MEWINQESKDSTGSAQSPGTPSPLILSPVFNGSVDNWRSLDQGSCTGKSWSPSPRRRLWGNSKKSSEAMDIGNLLSLEPRSTTCGKKTQPWLVPGSNSDVALYPDLAPLTGTKSGRQLLRMISMESQQTLDFVATLPSVESALTLQSLFLSSELAKCFGVRLELVNQGGLGKKQAWTLILKTPVLSGGAGTVVTQMWSSMNLEVCLLLLTIGCIDIAHLLRWLDRYPVIVEVKGGSQVLKAECIWITSNLDPRSWYPDLDQETLAALLRRLNITHFN